MSQAFLAALEGRRSYYDLTKDMSPSSPDDVTKILEHCMKHVPTPWNIQAGRAVVLLDGKSSDLWIKIGGEIYELIGGDSNPAAGYLAEKAKAHSSARGTIVFFEDSAPADAVVKSTPMVAAMLPGWAAESNSMLQFAVWTALEAEGLGASLQHHHQTGHLGEVISRWCEAPDTWKVSALMPFGGRNGGPPGLAEFPKAYPEVAPRYKVLS